MSGAVISTEDQKVDRKKFNDGYDLAFGEKKSKSTTEEKPDGAEQASTNKKDS